MKIVLLLVSHAVVAALGFAAGIYVLPIIAAPPAPTSAEVAAAGASATHRTQFKRDLPGSDALHWAEGTVAVSPSAVSFSGAMAPGPAYRLYLAPRFVQGKDEFLRERASMKPIGDIRTFDSFIVTLPAGVDIEAYDSVVVWCEAFDQFITAAKYR